MATTNIDSALPDVELGPGSVIEVNTGDAAALVTLLNVYTLSPVNAPTIAVEPVAPLLAYVPAV